MTIDLKAAAVRLGVSYATARKWANSQVLPAFHLAGRRKWSIDESDLERFIAVSKAGPESGPEGRHKRSQAVTNVADQKRSRPRKGEWMKQHAGQ